MSYYYFYSGYLAKVAAIQNEMQNNMKKSQHGPQISPIKKQPVSKSSKMWGTVKDTSSVAHIQSFMSTSQHSKQCGGE